MFIYFVVLSDDVNHLCPCCLNTIFSQQAASTFPQPAFFPHPVHPAGSLRKGSAPPPCRASPGPRCPAGCINVRNQPPGLHKVCSACVWGQASKGMQWSLFGFFSIPVSIKGNSHTPLLQPFPFCSMPSIQVFRHFNTPNN